MKREETLILQIIHKLFAPGGYVRPLREAA